MNYEQMSMGGLGPVPITGTDPVVGPFKILQACVDGCTISVLSGIDGAWSGISLAPGQSLYAGANEFESVTLSAGAAIGYRV